MRYGVIKKNECSEKRFTKWHASLEEAKAEAVRLLNKEKTPFTIVVALGDIDFDVIPTKFVKDFNFSEEKLRAKDAACQMYKNMNKDYPIIK